MINFLHVPLRALQFHFYSTTGAHLLRTGVIRSFWTYTVTGNNKSFLSRKTLTAANERQFSKLPNTEVSEKPKKNDLKRRDDEDEDEVDGDRGFEDSDSDTTGITYDYSEMFKEIANGDPEMEKRLKVAEFEVSVFRERFYKVPSFIAKKDWRELIEMKSSKGKLKFLHFLFIKQKKKEAGHEKKIKAVEYRRLQRLEETEHHHLNYSLGNNSMFLRIYSHSMLNLLYLRVFGAMMYSQHIIFDCSYNEYMGMMNNKYCARQIMFSYSTNRMHRNPFHIKLCNVNKNDAMIKHLMFLLNESHEDMKNMILDFTSEHYLDLYPKKNLVYLTPHAKDTLHVYNPQDIYIIGAYVDRGIGQKISLAKAKESNIRMAKLPLDDYLQWQKGVKSLPLNLVMNIMLDINLHRSWSEALKNIPKRNLTKPDFNRRKFVL